MAADLDHPAVPTLSDRLRTETADGHRALEAELDLLNGLTRERLAFVLRRFAGFHAGWEPAVARLLDEPALWEPRRRLAALHHDLALLALAPPEEAWPAPPWLCDRAAAWGSLYVMEGSTLGGQLIGRALRASGVEGLLYFDGRGREAGPLWRELRRRIDESEAPDRIVAGATATFHALRLWMRG